MANAGLDQNSRATLTALSSTGDGSIVTLYANPTTHRLLVDNAASSATITIGTTTITGGTTTRVLYDNAGVVGEYVISGTGNVAMTTSPTFVTPTLGAALATTINGNTFTTGTYTITGQAGKTLTFNGSITFTGTDAQVYTLPTTTATIARTDSAQTFTGVQTFSSTIVGSVNGNAATVTTNANLTGAVTSSGNATSLGSFSSANLATALTDETGTGANVFAGSPTFTGKPVVNNFDNTGATYAPSSGSQTVALDCTSNNMHIVSGNVNGTAITFTIANATNNQPFIVSILQGGTTVSTIASWFSTVRWAGGVAPTLTATLNKRDTFGFIRTGTNTYDGFIVGQNC